MDQPLSPSAWLAQWPLQPHEQLFAVLGNASDAQPFEAWQGVAAGARPRSVWAGTAYADWTQVMPYLAQVEPGSAFLDWVANTQTEDWGWLAVSSSPADVVLAHLQGLTQVKLPEGPPLYLLDAEDIAKRAPLLAWPIHISESIDSTNAEALRLIAAGHSAPFLVLAERQSAGRGRRGRKWVSPFAQNIYYSLVLRIDGGLRQLEGLSLAVGLAVMQALRDFGVDRAGLKWPNDVLVDGKKIAGILLELAVIPAPLSRVQIASLKRSAPFCEECERCKSGQCDVTHQPH